ncbi:MAG: LCP family protein [Ruminococcus sp.]|nr:LCP family protein [Ruminococcus sp.]
MSENKKIPNDMEPDLSELIASAKKKVQESKSEGVSPEDVKKAANPQSASQSARKSEKPDISFDKKNLAQKSNTPSASAKPSQSASNPSRENSAKRSTGAASGQAPQKRPAQSNASKPAQPKNQGAKPTASRSSQSSKPNQNARPTSNTNGNVKKGTASNRQGANTNKRAAQNAATSANKPKRNPTAGDGRSAANRSQANNKSKLGVAAAAGAASKKKTSSNGAKAAVAANASVGDVSADGTAVKKRFTKKQAATIGGLIGALILVLILVIFILFNHYFGLLGGEQEKINNSEEMTYSDVDLSRADTTDKEAEDAKLKELLAQGEKISNSDVMNILLIGEDLRDTEEGSAGNTDVMMIISVNTVDKTITMTSIMRDCYVNFQTDDGTWYATRINAAYWHGGVELTQRTIESYLNVEIDRYVLVNFTVFIDIVDALGGIDMYVTDEEANGYEGADPNGDNTRGMQNPLDEQNKYLGNPVGTDYIEEGGNLHLNGNQALAYARLRYVGNSDYERTERQRKVIAEMIKESRDLSIVEMDALANEILPQIKTDITKSEAAQLLVDMLDYRSYEIQEFRVPADGTFTNEIISGMDVLSVDFTANAEQFRELVYGSLVEDDEDDEDDGYTDYNY